MANPEHLAKLREGVTVWNAWRAENWKVRVDLSEANLIEADLDKADLSGAKLTETNFDEAYLIGANLRGANLTGAILCEANVEKARLYETVFAIYRHSLQGQCASVGSNLTTGVKPPWRSSIAR